MALTAKKRDKLTVENTPCEWRTYQDGVQFELYSIAHPLYLQAVSVLERKAESVDILNLNENDDSIELQIKATGRYLVKNWKGIENEKGEPLELTPDNFADLVLSHLDVFSWIIEQCSDIAKKQAEAVEKLKKKSSTDTNGKKNMQD